ncbi:MAG: hypothetical protein QW743_04395 [Candidatus Methanomethylicia archaeon]
MSERALTSILFIFMMIIGIILLTLEQDIGILVLLIGGILLLINGINELRRGVKRRV